MVDIVKNVATVLALGVGAVWAYYKFFKGRTYLSRLEPSVLGEIIDENGTSYLLVTTRLKNVGLSNVKITQKGTAVEVFTYAAQERPGKTRKVADSHLYTFSVFEDHAWIEPGETIEDQRLLVLAPGNFPAIRIALRLVSNGKEWNSATILKSRQVSEDTHTETQIESPRLKGTQS